MAEINTEKIIKQVKKEIKDKKYTQNKIKFDDVEIENCNVYENSNNVFNKYELLESIDKLKELYSVSTNKPIQSHRPIIGKIIIFFKKLARKMLKFYIEPIVEDQNKYNNEVINALTEIQKYISENDKSNKRKTK